MRLSGLIRTRLESYDGGLHDAKGRPVSRETALREYRAIRSYLLEHGCEDGCAALRLDYGYRYVLSIFACLEIGLPYLPMRADWPKARVDQVLGLARSPLTLDEDALRRAIERPARPARESFPRDPERPAYVLCTSGSTGRPKAAVLPRRALESFLARWGPCTEALGSRLRQLMTVDFSFDFSLLHLGLFLLKGGSLHLSGFEADPFKLAHEIQTLRIDALLVVPTTMSRLADDGVFSKTDWSALRALYLGGARFPYALYRELFVKLPGRTVHNLYGPTETCVVTHLKKLSGIESEDVRDGHVTVGPPMPGVRCRLEDGELLLGGPQVMTGYLVDPEKTRDALVARTGGLFYRSGDLAFADERGQFYIVGRTDDTIKRRGFRINLSDIDAYIQRLDSVRDSATVAFEAEDRGLKLVSYVIAKGSTSPQALRGQMAEVLLDYQLPDRIRIVERLPTLESGKIDRTALQRDARGDRG